MEGTKQSPRRTKNEDEHPQGFPLANMDRFARKFQWVLH